MENAERTIKKLNEVFKLGYLPSRRGEPYTFETKFLANCFEHACFNLTNQMLLSSHFDEYDSQVFRSFYPDGVTQIQIANNFLDFIQETGLKVRICQHEEKVGPRSWKVALYFMNDPWGEHDYHFYLQLRTGKWSAKIGFTDFTEKVKRIDPCMREYQFYDMMEITSPYDGRNRNSVWRGFQSKKETVSVKSGIEIPQRNIVLPVNDKIVQK